MTLPETYKAVAPSIVALSQKWQTTQHGLPPAAPAIFGTGFLVHENGIVATNRHVAECFATIPDNPMTGEPGYAAMISDYESPQAVKGESSFQMMFIEILGHSSVGGNASQPRWYGELQPDIAFVQLKIKETPFLELATHDFYIEPGTAIAT